MRKHLRLKQLYPVELSRPGGEESEDSHFICPSCKADIGYQQCYALTRCRHVLCQQCHKMCVVPDKQCPICSAAAQPKTIIKLGKGGAFAWGRGGWGAAAPLPRLRSQLLTRPLLRRRLQLCLSQLRAGFRVCSRQNVGPTPAGRAQAPGAVVALGTDARGTRHEPRCTWPWPRQQTAGPPSLPAPTAPPLFFWGMEATAPPAVSTTDDGSELSLVNAREQASRIVAEAEEKAKAIVQEAQSQLRSAWGTRIQGYLAKHKGTSW